MADCGSTDTQSAIRNPQSERYGCPTTFTGTLLSVVVPLPSSPDPLLPQQYRMPATVMPQACPAPALSAEKVSPPGTATGSEPKSTPQQYAVPPVVRPHVCHGPALSAENVSPPTTPTGLVLQDAPLH